MIYKEVLPKDRAQILCVLRHYDLEIKRFKVTQNTLANVNRIFFVQLGLKKFILRESNPSTKLSHLHFETDVLSHLFKKGFSLVPQPIQNKEGKLVTRDYGKYYSLQSFLPGKVTESVSNLVRFNDAKLINFFETSARFTKAVQDFKGKIPGDNRTLFYYAKNGAALFRSLSRKISYIPIKRLLDENKKFLGAFMQGALDEMVACKYNEQPKQVVHFDIHPGNVSYDGDKVSGLFDFDWARWDCRIADLACTMGQSCYTYKGKSVSKYNAAKIALGLKAYRAAYGKSEYDLALENRLLRVAFKGYMLYQLFWIIGWYLEHLDKSEEGLRYIAFSINVLKLNDFDELIG
jgi:homoserine kinase type II